MPSECRCGIGFSKERRDLFLYIFGIESKHFYLKTLLQDNNLQSSTVMYRRHRALFKKINVMLKLLLKTRQNHLIRNGFYWGLTGTPM